MYKIIASSVSAPPDGMFLGSAILAVQDHLYEAHEHRSLRFVQRTLIRRPPSAAAAIIATRPLVEHEPPTPLDDPADWFAEAKRYEDRRHQRLDLRLNEQYKG